MSATVASPSNMSKRKDVKRDDSPARIDSKLLSDARIIAAARDVSLAEYLSEALKPTIERDLQDLQQELAKRTKAGQPKRSGGESQ